MTARRSTSRNEEGQVCQSASFAAELELAVAISVCRPAPEAQRRKHAQRRDALKPGWSGFPRGG
eukprot:13125119-Alexandrium_andersonii.AAC.1